MGLHLSASRLRSLEEALSALSAPLDRGSEEAWLDEVGARVVELLGAAGGGVVVSGPHEGLTARFLGLDEGVVDTFSEVVAGAADGSMRFRYPDLARLMRRMEVAGVRVWTPSMAERLARVRVREMPYTREVVGPSGTGHHVTATTSLPGARAVLAFFHASPDRDPLGEDRVPVLRLLLPALDGGLRTLRAFRRGRDALTRQRETDPRAWFVFARDGRLLHANPAAERLMADERRSPLREEARRSARRLTELRAPDTKTSGVRPRLPTEPEVTVDSVPYRLSASFLPEGLAAGGWTVAVCAEALTPTLPGVEAIRDRTGLTPRQAQVARLIARGLSGPEIADRLGISVHTVRRHTEAVLAGLGIGSRAAVAGRLLGPVVP